MNNLIMNAPEYYIFTFKVRTVEYETYSIEIVATTHENAFTELFRIIKRSGLPIPPVTKIIDVEPYVFE